MLPIKAFLKTLRRIPSSVLQGGPLHRTALDLHPSAFVELVRELVHPTFRGQL